MQKMELMRTLPSNLKSCLAKMPAAEMTFLVARFENLISAGKFETKKAELALAVNKENLSAIKVKDIKDVFDTDRYATLATLKKYRGEDFAKLYVISELVKLVNFVNVGNNMRQEQLADVAEMILDDYYFLNIADIKLFFYRCKKGDYGVLYNRLDGQLILEYLEKYCDTRGDSAESVMIDENNTSKSATKTSNIPNWLIEKFAVKPLVQDEFGQEQAKEFEKTYGIALPSDYLEKRNSRVDEQVGQADNLLLEHFKKEYEGKYKESKTITFEQYLRMQMVLLERRKK